jgi:hypothetical protein
MALVLFALQQHQALFDLTIGVFASEAAARKAADDMNDAYEAALPRNPLKHSVRQMPINTILADVALPYDPSVCTFRQAEALQHFERVLPGCCGPPPQPVDPSGVLWEWRGRTEGSAADAFGLQLAEKLSAARDTFSFAAFLVTLRKIWWRANNLIRRRKAPV